MVTGTSAFTEACGTIRGLLATLVRDEVSARHQIGGVVRQVMGSTDKYGAHAIERLATELRISTAILYAAAAVAETWSEADLQRMSTRTMRHGEPLSWSHFVALSKVRSAQKRGALAERCLAEGWSVRELRDEVSDLQPSRADYRGSGEDTVRVAVDEGVRAARRAAADISTFIEALEERLGDDEHDDLLARALVACDDLDERLQAARSFLRGTTRSSGRRVRIEPRAHAPTDPCSVDSDDTAPPPQRHARARLAPSK
jgi:hypothetical protein